MQKPTLPPEEPLRIAELHQLGVLDTPPEERFDRITRTARTIFGVQTALISLVDVNRQWFKSKQGLDANETSRDISFCGHAIHTDHPFIIEDTLLDQRFSDNPLVTQAPFIRFYCGMPLHGPSGMRLGTLCLIDSTPKQIHADQLGTLKDLADWAETELGATRAAQNANDAQTRLETILNYVQDAVFTLDVNFQIIHSNAAAAKMFNQGTSAFDGMALNDLIIPIQAAPDMRAFYASVVGHTQEMVGLRGNEQFALELSLSAMQMDQKPCYTAIVREISERKRAEKQIRERDRLFYAVMESTASFVHVRDINGRYLYVNKEYEHVFECKNDAIRGKSYTEVLDPELAAIAAHFEKQIIATGKSIRTETKVQRSDGERVFLVIRSPLFDEQGTVIGTCGVGSDITAMRKLEKDMEQTLSALRESEERWSFALEGSGDGVWDWDIPNNVVLLSKRGKAMLGYEEHEVGNGNNEWDTRVHPDDKQAAVAALQDNLDGKTESFTNEHRVRCKDGSYIWLLDRGKVVERSADGKPLRVIGTHTNITARKNMERIQSEFISTVSHELRTPLTSIRGSLGLLEGGVLGEIPAKAKGIISVANKNCQRLITLVNDILDMDKLMSGKMGLQLVRADLNDVVQQAIEANAGYAQQYKIVVAFSKLASPAWAKLDLNRGMQVLTNLLSNAIKFTRENTAVSLRLVAQDSFWRIEVRDHGEGIPVEFQSRIFEAFAQADSANTRQQGGTGLGLNISKSLVEQMLGTIGYETQTGVGTTFWFTLPAAEI